MTMRKSIPPAPKITRDEYLGHETDMGVYMTWLFAILLI